MGEQIDTCPTCGEKLGLNRIVLEGPRKSTKEFCLRCGLSALGLGSAVGELDELEVLRHYHTSKAAEFFGFEPRDLPPVSH
jgi:hypothetical protein